MELILPTMIGTIAGMTGSVAGLGGGIIIVPALIYLMNLPSQQAVGTSLVVIVFVAVSSVISYAKQGRIDYKSAFYFMVFSIPGSIIGANVGKDFSDDIFSVFFGILLILIFLYMLINPKQKDYSQSTNVNIKRQFTDSMGKQYNYGFNKFSGMCISFCVGFISSLFGIGGGVLMVPAMIMLFAFPPHIATATSMFIILFSALVGSLTHMALEHIKWEFVALLAPGAYIGGILGAKLASIIPSKLIIYILRALILVIAIRMII